MTRDRDRIDPSFPAEATGQEDRSGRDVAEGERQRFRWLDFLRPSEGEGAQQRLRSQVVEASKILPPKGPIDAFVAQNPLQGLEHLPFDQAIRDEAQRLLGGQGYLSNEAFRQIYASGRITQDDLSKALETKAPHLARRPPIEVRGRRVEAIDVCLAQMLHRIDPLPHGTLRWQVSHAKSTVRFRQDLPPEKRKHLLDQARHELQQQGQQNLEAHAVSGLWAAVMAKLGRSNPVSLEDQEAHVKEALLHRVLAVARDGFHPRDLRADLVRNAHEFLGRDIGRIGREWTLGDFFQRITGAGITGPSNDQMIRWCAAFLDEGLAGWPMPYRERGFYDAWRRLAERDLTGWFLGMTDFTRKIRQLPPYPEDAVILSLRAMGIPEEHWTGYLTLHLAALPGWAGMVNWRETHPVYEMQRRYPIELTQYLAVRLFYERELVSTLCRKEWEIDGTVPALHSYFRDHPGEYFARSQIAAGGLPDALAGGVVRIGQGAIALNWDAFTHPGYG
ncbi:MAG: putative inorganic carbon transporter subunit DabA, partial [Candidatus Methylomirabilis sp.]